METQKLGQEPASPIDGMYAADAFRSNNQGMSKRFYAASVILQGLCANPKNTKISSNLFIRTIQLFFPSTNIKATTGDSPDMVRIAYNMADELLKQENQ